MECWIGLLRLPLSTGRARRAGAASPAAQPPSTPRALIMKCARRAIRGGRDSASPSPLLSPPPPAVPPPLLCPSLPIPSMTTCGTRARCGLGTRRPRAAHAPPTRAPLRRRRGARGCQHGPGQGGVTNGRQHGHAVDISGRGGDDLPPSPSPALPTPATNKPVKGSPACRERGEETDSLKRCEHAMAVAHVSGTTSGTARRPCGRLGRRT